MKRRYCVPFMPFSGILGGTAVTDRTMINDLPVTGVFGHLPSEAFRVSFEHAFCMTTFMRMRYLSFVYDSHDVVTPARVNLRTTKVWLAIKGR